MSGSNRPSPAAVTRARAIRKGLTETGEHTPMTRLQRHGPRTLDDAELLSLFMIGRSPEKAIRIAHEALEVAGGFGGVVAREFPATYTVPGLTERSVALLAAADEITRRSLGRRLERAEVLTSPSDVVEYLSAVIGGLDHEVFVVLFLDNRHRIIECKEMFRGTLDSTAVYPREIVKAALSRNAASVLLAHNHPTGIAEPSDSDVRMTRRVADALALVDVRVLDHVIIGRGESTSLGERGLM